MPHPPSRRLGIFGGSFDPVHHGHLRLADCCWRQLQLDQLWLVPAATQPLKPDGPHASDADRLAMLRLATAQRAEFRVSEREINRGGPSYTVDTLREIAKEDPQADIFFLLGADALSELPTWRSPQEICDLATLAVVHRAGAPAPDLSVLESMASADRLRDIAAAQVEMPPVEISSSEIRQCVAAGRPWRDFVPPAVADYIAERGLYG